MKPKKWTIYYWNDSEGYRVACGIISVGGEEMNFGLREKIKHENENGAKSFFTVIQATQRTLKLIRYYGAACLRDGDINVKYKFHPKGKTPGKDFPVIKISEKKAREFGFYEYK